MLPVHRWLIVSHGDENVWRAAAEAQSPRFQMRLVGGASDLESLARSAPPASLALVAGETERSAANASPATLVDSFPSCGFVFVLRGGAEPVVEYAQAGVAEVILLNSESSADAFRSRLRLANARTVRRMAVRLFGPGRTEREQRVLDEPWRAVSQVAAMCGYSNPNALRTAFARTVGVPPGELRAAGALPVTAAAFREDRARDHPS